MSIAIRDRRDPVVSQAPLPGLTVRREDDVLRMSSLQERTREEIEPASLLATARMSRSWATTGEGG